MINRKGFTLVELMIIVAIIGLIAAWAIPYFVAPAHGMDLSTYYDANRDNEKVVTRLMINDPSLTVIILAYSPTWTHDNRATDMTAPAMAISKRLTNSFGSRRVSVVFANEGGLKDDVLPTPAKEGIYFYLD